MHSASFFFSSSSHAVSLASSLCSSADEEKGDVVFDITYITLLVGSIIKILHGGREVRERAEMRSVGRERDREREMRRVQGSETTYDFIWLLMLLMILASYNQS